MAGLSTAFMNFTTGVLEADKKNTKENLLIRGKELDAKRNAVLEMKKSKYNDEIETYKKDKVKIDGLNAVQADWDKGKYKITKDGKTGTDTKALGYDFLVAKHGIEWVQKQKTHLLGAESDPTAWNAYLNSKGRDLDIKGDKLFTNFKERNVIDSNYLESLDKIEKKYTTALKAAKNDSSLINAILGKKNEEISLLEEDAKTTSKNISTIDNVNSTIDSSEKKILDEIQTDISTTTNEPTFVTPDEPVFIPKSYKDNFTTKIDDARKVDYSSKEYNNQFANTVLTLIPNAKAKDYFEVESTGPNKGSLSAKSSIINADVTIQSLINNSLDDVTLNDTFKITGNNKSKIDFNANKRFNLAKNYVEEYGTWYADGKVLSGGSLKNLFKKTSTALVVPANSIININDNKLKGFGVVINKDLIKDVGKVYKNFIVQTAEERMKTEGGTLEENINILQRQIENDNNGNNTLTKDARTFIAMALKDVKNQDGELVYPSLTAKKEDDTDSKKSTMDIKQEELSSGTTNKFSSARIVMVDINGDGNKTPVPLTDKNKKILEANQIEIPAIKEESDEDSILEKKNDSVKTKKVGTDTVIKKIVPADVGIKNQPVFESLQSIQKILPNEMTGKEIKEKYEINFYLPNRAIFKPFKEITKRGR